MAHALNATALSASAPAAAKKGFFARLLDAMIASRYESAARELRRHDALMKGFHRASDVSVASLPFETDKNS